MSERRSKHHESLNVREQLVGEEEAERLGIEDDRRTALATMGLGALMVVMSAVVLVQAMRLPDADGPVGPATAPWVVGVLLFVCGAMMVVSGRRNMGTWEVSEHTTSQDWLRMLVLLAVLVVFAIVMPLLGYVVASTFLFGTTAIVLGAPHRLRSYVYGWCISVLVFLVFDIAIGLALPTGPWGF